jgi:hypothetical protein
MCTLCKTWQLSGQTKYVREWLKLNGQMPLLNGYNRSFALLQVAFAYSMRATKLSLRKALAFICHEKLQKHAACHTVINSES